MEPVPLFGPLTRGHVRRSTFAPDVEIPATNAPPYFYVVSYHAGAIDAEAHVPAHTAVYGFVVYMVIPHCSYPYCIRTLDVLEALVDIIDRPPGIDLDTIRRREAERRVLAYSLYDTLALRGTVENFPDQTGLHSLILGHKSNRSIYYGSRLVHWTLFSHLSNLPCA